MKKVFLLLFSLLLLLPAKADEGMWLPIFIQRLNYVDMQKDGLQLTAEEIYSINNSSIKDAVPIFGRGCTSELISPQGLLLTNHHCGYGNITDLSTPEKNYLDNGFWARSMKEELPAKGLTVQFFERMEDVTQQMMAVNKEGNSETKNGQLRFKEAQKIEKAASEDGKYTAVVKSFYGGNEYYLFVYKTYRDVRLVGAPPASIGKFGGDTDNWMWPRHTGDFSMFRVYADANNEPADYSPDNVPLKSKHFFKLNISDKKEGDFAFIMGYPGTTERYLTSYGIDYRVQEEYPAFVAAREEKLNIMKKAMDSNDEVRLNYADKYASISNYWKNRMGMIYALTKNKTADRKRDQEVRITEWIEADSTRQAKYGDILEVNQEYYNEKAKTAEAVQWISQGVLSGSPLFQASFMSFKGNFKNEAFREKVVAIFDKTYDRVDLDLEADILKAVLNKIYKEIPQEQLPEEFLAAVEKYGSVDALVDEIEKTSRVFKPEEAKKAALAGNKDFFKKSDIGVDLYTSFFKKYKELSSSLTPYNEKYIAATRLFQQVLKQVYEGEKVFYPDANFTMRLTYGKVLPYDPQDGVTYNFETTLDGIAAKHKPGNREFDAPAKILELQETKNYGPYADSKGRLVVAFLTNHDITGGNSGSPVLNAKGELIGVAFDGNWEAMSGDIEFEPNLQRTISVDIRYVLFVIDKFANAQNIIDELVIVKDEPVKEEVKAKKLKKVKKVKKAKQAA